MLLEVNPYVRDFIQIADFDESEVASLKFVINPAARPRTEHRRVHNHNLREVAVLYNENPQPSDIIVHRKSGGLSIVSDTHRAFDPLHFVLLFPFGTDGWHLNIPQRLFFWLNVFCFLNVLLFQWLQWSDGY